MIRVKIRSFGEATAKVLRFDNTKTNMTTTTTTTTAGNDSNTADTESAFNSLLRRIIDKLGVVSEFDDTLHPYDDGLQLSQMYQLRLGNGNGSTGNGCSGSGGDDSTIGHSDTILEEIEDIEHGDELILMRINNYHLDSPITSHHQNHDCVQLKIENNVEVAIKQSNKLIATAATTTSKPTTAATPHVTKEKSTTSLDSKPVAVLAAQSFRAYPQSWLSSSAAAHFRNMSNMRHTHDNINNTTTTCTNDESTVTHKTSTVMAMAPPPPAVGTALLSNIGDANAFHKIGTVLRHENSNNSCITENNNALIGRTISQQKNSIILNFSCQSPSQSRSQFLSFNREPKKFKEKGGKLPFPVLLYCILEDVSAAIQMGTTSNMAVVADPIISWEDQGKGFKIHQPEVFNDIILPKYARSNQNTTTNNNTGGHNTGGTNKTTRVVVVHKKKTVYRSFQRQLNIYGFKMHKKTRTYYHTVFHRGCDL